MELACEYAVVHGLPWNDHGPTNLQGGSAPGERVDAEWSLV